MYSNDALMSSFDCSDFKLDEYQKRWTQLMLNWLNKCVHPKTPAKELHIKSLMKVLFKYKDDVFTDDIDSAVLFSDDIETFIEYKYPILGESLYETTNMQMRIYTISAVLLFHCCINSSGLVDSDICLHLGKREQEMILRFCECLSDMEVSSHNIQCAIAEACESVDASHANKQKIKANVKRKPLPDNSSTGDGMKNTRPMKMKVPVTVLPSAIETDSSSHSDNDCTVMRIGELKPDIQVKEYREEMKEEAIDECSDLKRRCQPDCACSRCSPSGVCCGDPGSSIKECDNSKDIKKGETAQKDSSKFITFIKNYKWRICFILSALLLILLLILVALLIIATQSSLAQVEEVTSDKETHKLFEELRIYHPNFFTCKNNLCQKVYEPTKGKIYASMSRCVLQCMGPQLWPLPIGHTSFSKQLIAISTKKLEYKFQSVPSDPVRVYLGEAFKLFIGDLVRLEKMAIKSQPYNITFKDIPVKKMNIIIDIDTDPDPRLRLNTEESYTIKLELDANQVVIQIQSSSFCGVRHGLETLSQMILLDQSSGLLITVAKAEIKDAPSYKYRGLMIDTGRNYIPVKDLIRTVDAMATCKLNTFHWRISDVTSFPLLLNKLPALFEYGAYDRSLVYTKEDVETVVKRAGIRGIRVLIEVAAPGPIGRPWSWVSETTCPTKNNNSTCDNLLCLRLSIHDSVMDILQIIYTEIIAMTGVDDIFHLSDGIFSLANCFHLIEDRQGFLDKTLERLRLANRGFLPKLPVVWYTRHLTNDFEAKIWDRYGVQLTEWEPNPSNQFMSRFKVIHSSKWDLSCEVKKQRCKKYRTWQEMYGWKSWRNIDVFTIQGGETLLWTDLVDSGNLDYHLWPRAAAVAERLWSDIIVNASATPLVYVRLDNHRWRLLLKSVKMQPVWPLYCSFNPEACMQQIR